MDKDNPSMQKSPGADQPTHSYSCVLCRQRKIKCDKQQPCLNCIRAQKECVYNTPAPPRRRKGRIKLSEEQLLRRLRHYEALLKSYGANIEEINKYDDDYSKLSNGTSNSSIALSSCEIKPTIDGGRSVVPVHDLWTSLSRDLLEGLSEDEEEESFYIGLDEREFLLPSETGAFIFDPRSIDSQLTTFHPPPQQIFKLWQVFLDNVNPLTKIIHTPTVQGLLLEASVGISCISRPMEALMFAIYSCAITSLSNEDCQLLLGEPRIKVRALYHLVTQQALMRAGLFGTKNIVVLQAAVLFLIAFKRDYDPGELWTLMGILIRIGQRFGLHREADMKHISPLELEVRRRLWWQIIVLDARSSERSGIGASVNAGLWETPRPLNVNDSDLTAEMTVPPLNRVGVTEMLFPLMMYEVGDFLRHSKSMEAFHGSWHRLSDHTVPLIDKDKVINELEDLLENKFLRYCDPAIPLHKLARDTVMIVTGRMRLATRHPSQYPDKGLSISREEKMRLFEICLMMIERDNRMHSTPSIRGFLWNMHLQSQLDAIVYVLTELRYQGTGSKADKAWSQIAEVFVHHHDIITDTKNPLYAAVRSLSLKSWEAREAECLEQHLSEAQNSPPLFISEILSLKAQNASNPLSEGTSQFGNPFHTTQDIVDGGEAQFNSTLVPETLPKEVDMMDWNYWNDLMHGPVIAEMPTFDYQEIYNPESASYNTF